MLVNYTQVQGCSQGKKHWSIDQKPIFGSFILLLRDAFLAGPSKKKTQPCQKFGVGYSPAQVVYGVNICFKTVYLLILEGFILKSGTCIYNHNRPSFLSLQCI